jgi:hypothetical protein
MKKNVLTFGLISGLLITAMLLYSAAKIYSGSDFRGNEVLGYASMIVAFSFIFIGVRNYRNKYNKGYISFGKALKIGVLISLIASTMYVVVWLVEYYVFMPDFADRYAQCVIKNAIADGESAEVINQKKAQVETIKTAYQNPLLVILLTYTEVFPIGLIISLISALILKKKPRPGETAFLNA